MSQKGNQNEMKTNKILNARRVCARAFAQPDTMSFSYNLIVIRIGLHCSHEEDTANEPENKINRRKSHAADHLIWINTLIYAQLPVIIARSTIEADVKSKQNVLNVCF